MMQIKTILNRIAIVLFVVFGATLWAIYEANMPPLATPPNEERLFSVSVGASVKSVISALKRDGYIRSESLAYMYARVMKIHINAGTYHIPEHSCTFEVLDYLQAGVQELKKITMPEGLTLKKNAKILADARIVDYQEFLRYAKKDTLLQEYHIPSTSVEGYLFPDTYFFNYSETAESVLRAMLDNFFKQVKTIKNFPTEPQQIFETVVLASIVEREYQRADEAAKIAGVFQNRLRIKMGLQSCATVEYIITEIQNKAHPTRLFSKDIKINNPYNTYLWRGLPPGAIANPGLVALNAVCNPIKSDFLYFRLIDETTGTHIFSKTLSEHGKARLLLKRAAGH